MHLRTETDLKAFYSANYKDCVRQALRIVNELHEAEDIVQECMVKLWDKRNDIGEKENLVYYFKKMVRNRSIDHLRRRMPLDDSTDLPEIGEAHSDHLELAELSNKIDDLIDSLPEKCRQIFVLSRYEGMTYKEISGQLSIAPKTVENQISRALKVLRAGLGDQLFSFFL
ncbi:MAG: RNA polymerase sigma-70 factor [Bacteroidetes bacterium]|nr:RNA polymerase sigma-70 factor [Bacteroidota bacterium]